MRRTLAFTCWLGLAAIPAVAFQAPPPPPADQGPKVINVNKIKDNFYVLKGGGGNTSVFITQNNGVVVVNTKLPGWGPLLVNKIKSITDKPITTIINTHTHADHTSGNPDFPAGIQIVAQENTKVDMQKMDLFKKPENAQFLPTKTFKDKLTLFSGPDEVDVYYFGRGGTNGDAWVVFPSLRIMAAGDEFAAKGVTLIDEANGGSALELVKTLNRVAKEIRNVDIVVPGHSDMTYTFADVKEWADFNRDLVNWITAEKKAGKTVDEAVAEYKNPAKYSGYATPNPRNIKNYSQAVYDDLSK